FSRDWSSDVCSSDVVAVEGGHDEPGGDLLGAATAATGPTAAPAVAVVVAGQQDERADADDGQDQQERDDPPGPAAARAAGRLAESGRAACTATHLMA